MKRILAVLLALMLVTTSGALIAAAEATQVDRSENVTLYVTAFVSNYEGDGVRKREENGMQISDLMSLQIKRGGALVMTTVE